MDAKVEAAFQQLFHGDPDTETVYFEAGANKSGPLAYVSDIGNHDVRTEGMSYGMMIAVQLNHKNGRVRFTLELGQDLHVYRQSEASFAGVLFRGRASVSGEPNDETPAPDGEEYFCDGALL